MAEPRMLQNASPSPCEFSHDLETLSNPWLHVAFQGRTLFITWLILSKSPISISTWGMAVHILLSPSCISQILHILCGLEPLTQDLVFDEKFLLLLVCLNLTPQTQRLNTTVQRVSINHHRDQVTEGNDNIFWRLLGPRLLWHPFLPPPNANIYLVWPDGNDSSVSTDLSRAGSVTSVLFTQNLFPFSGFLPSI